ncbi:PadR family transcriptional regulator [Clostridium saccharoperbutylacetonicum]|uniref:PadR family transcriptional regulator n=1 Tax=Clostridium saccharoperbutylacetonicum TaxID=36745 RepID=UPI000983C2B9|nr:PadR family transcriptional regulator [Clostridium saccharoperbutylacetonicum]AQR94271.1 transcriptional regulator PadR-like family protein [Clostridium saccharoperbutylacetonicum]NSB29971.1 DNA-binding PadR family transcriptional regulator [Clostridium saccharoperbutylacetonicum]
MKKTRYVLLGLLQEEELSGYEMKKIINMRMSFFWQESFGQIYPELSKMMKEGLIDFSKQEPSDKIKREKIRYTITSKGQKELKQWMEAENEKDTARSELLLKMYLSTDKNSEEMRKHIIKFKEEAEGKLELFKLFDADLNQNIEMHNNHRNILCVLNLGMRQTKLYIDWSNEMLELLNKDYE